MDSTQVIDAGTVQAAAVAPAGREGRVVSVDALRGFDMFWIMGGATVARALDGLGAGGATSTIATQLKHAEWEGFRFYDGIFPLFLFLVGISIVFSMERVLAKGGRFWAMVRIARRGVLLFAAGVFYSGGVSRTWPDIALGGVLQRIAACYVIAATLYLLLPRRGIVVAAVLCLVGYWGMLMFVPFPDVNLKHANVGRSESQKIAKTPEKLFGGVTARVHGTFEEGRNLTNYVDACWLPGKKANLYYINEGLLSTLPCVAIPLFGIMAGWVLTSTSMGGGRKVAWLVGAGAAAIAVGALWGLQFPIIKRIWSSSFCLVAGGYAAILMGVFYLVVDVWKLRKWCTPLLWIGSNALAIYLMGNMVEFQSIATRLVGGDVAKYVDAHVRAGVGGVVIACVGLMLPVLVARLLYKHNIHIRL